MEAQHPTWTYELAEDGPSLTERRVWNPARPSQDQEKPTSTSLLMMNTNLPNFTQEALCSGLELQGRIRVAESPGDSALLGAMAPWLPKPVVTSFFHLPESCHVNLGTTPKGLCPGAGSPIASPSVPLASTGPHMLPDS